MAQTNVNTHNTPVTDMFRLFEAVASKFGPSPAVNGPIGAFHLQLAGTTATFTRTAAGGQAVLTITNVDNPLTWGMLCVDVMYATTVVALAAESAPPNNNNKAASDVLKRKFDAI